MASATISVDFSEMDGSPEIRWSRDGLQITRTLKCAWSDAPTLAQELMGQVATLPEGQGSVTYDPHGYQLLNNTLQAIVESVQIEPFGGTKGGVVDGDGNEDTTQADYDYAKVIAEYRTPEYSLFSSEEATGPGSDEPTDEQEAEEQDLLTRRTFEFSTGVEYITMPNAKLYWYDGTALTTDEAPGRMIHTLEIVVNFHDINYIPKNIVEYAGYVNQNQRTFEAVKNAWTFEPETLLYKGCTGPRDLTSQGFKGRDLTMTFSWRPDGWNKFPRAGQTTLEAIYDTENPTSTEDGRVKPYPVTDFSSIWVAFEKPD